jgi:hypothetical protein
MASARIQPLSVVQINLTGLFNGQRCICTFHYYAQAEGTAPTVTMFDFLQAWHNVLWHNLVDPDLGLDNMFHETVTDVSLTGQIVAGTGSRSLLEVFDASPSTGAHTGGIALPSGNAIVLSRTGRLAGPKNRGRIYTFGVPSIFNDQSMLTQTCKDTINLIIPQLQKTFDFGQVPNRLLMHTCVITGFVPPTTAQQDLTYGINPSIRYQRRREVGRGI